MSQPSDDFNPYFKWLGIPESQMPPNHYTLLGLTLFESDPEVIASASDSRMMYLRTFQMGKYADLSQKLLNELAAARVCLLNRKQKALYDRELHARQTAGAAVAPVAVAITSKETPVKPVMSISPASTPTPVGETIRPGVFPAASRSDAIRKPAHKKTASSLIVVVIAGVVLIGLLLILMSNSPSEDPQNTATAPKPKPAQKKAPAEKKTPPSTSTTNEKRQPRKTDSTKPDATTESGEDDNSDSKTPQTGVDPDVPLMTVPANYTQATIPVYPRSTVVYAPKEPSRPCLDVIHRHDIIGVNYRDAGRKQLLSLSGRKYAKGLYCHAPCCIRVVLPKPAVKFTAMLGLDDSCEGKGRVRFIFWADGQLLFESPEIHGGANSCAVTIPMPAVREFIFYVSHEGNPSDDHADVLVPQVFYEDGTSEYISDLPVERRTNDDRVRPISQMPDEVLASCSEDGTVKLWDPQTGGLLNILSGATDIVRRAQFSPDGKYLFAASHDHTVHVWDTHTGHEAYTLYGHLGRVDGVEFSPDGKRFATAGMDGSIRIWDVATLHETSILRDFKGSAFRAIWSPDAERLISIGTDSGVYVRNGKSCELITTLKAHNAQLCDLAISEDGTFMATGDEDGKVCVWSISGLNLLHSMQLFKGQRTSSFAPDNRTIATIGYDGVIHLVDAITGKITASLTGHGDFGMNVLFSPDGKRLFSSAKDSTVRVWDVKSGKTLRVLACHYGGVWQVAYFPYKP